MLLKIAAMAQKQGVAAHEVLLAEEIVRPEDYYLCLAHALNLPFSWDPNELGPAMADPCALRAGIAHGVAPGTVAMAPQGQALLGLLDLRARRLAPGGKRMVITTPDRFALWVRAACADTIAERASLDLGRADPSLTAAQIPSRRTAAALAMTATFAAVGLVAGGLAWLLVSSFVCLILCGASRHRRPICPTMRCPATQSSFPCTRRRRSSSICATPLKPSTIPAPSSTSNC